MRIVDNPGSTRSRQRSERSSRCRWLSRSSALGNRANHTKTFLPTRTGRAGNVFCACSLCRHATGAGSSFGEYRADLMVEEVHERPSDSSSFCGSVESS